MALRRRSYAADSFTIYSRQGVANAAGGNLECVKGRLSAMTYAEVVQEPKAALIAEGEALEAHLTAIRWPDGKIPRLDELAPEEWVREMAREDVENPTLFRRPRKSSRGGMTLTGGHPDGRLRWVEGVLLEGDPSGPYWQAEFAKAEPLTEAEMAEDDWWIEAYGPLDF